MSYTIPIYSQDGDKSISEIESEIQDLKAEIERIQSVINDKERMISVKKDALLSKTDKEGAPFYTFIAIDNSVLFEDSHSSSKRLGSFPGGSEFRIIGYSDGYFNVCNDTICGWMNPYNMANSEERDSIKRDLELIEEEEKKRIKEQEEKEAAQRRADYRKKQENDQLKTKQILISLYGYEIANRIENEEVWIGMTKEQAQHSWGIPNDINRTTTTYGVKEQWVYESRGYLYFEDGKVTAIQD